MEILVVEDNPVTNRLLQKILEKWDHQVKTALNGKEAWDIIEGSNVRIDITDWIMPKMDGVDLCKKIRSADLDRYIYIIFLTGKDQKKDLLKGLESGADDYLAKPFDHDELKVRLRVGERIIYLEKQNQETHTKLIHTDKLASIGQLAAGVAHEINNPTGYICSNINTLGEYINDLKKLINNYIKIEELLGDNYQESNQGEIEKNIKDLEILKKKIDLEFVLEDSINIINESREGAERIKKIVTDLKDFSHVDQTEMKHVSINNGIESTLNIVWNELKYKATVEKKYGDLPEILCYPQKLNQVFMNILVNAAHSIENKGTIIISTCLRNGQVEIKISDTGKGIPEKNLSKIFDPFFTTKPVGQGTGLGLNIVYGIIKKHKGTIEVESKVGEGTTFTIRIPVGDSEEVRS